MRLKTTVELDLFAVLEKSYKFMEGCYDFAFEDGKLVPGRAHQVLQQIGTLAGKLQRAAQSPAFSAAQKDPWTEILLDQVSGSCSVILSDQTWAYPDGTLDKTRSGSALNCLQTSFSQYRKSLRPMARKACENKSVPFGLCAFADSFSLADEFGYFFKNQNIEMGSAHAGTQMLMAGCVFLETVLSSVNADGDPELAELLKERLQELAKIQKAFRSCYPAPQDTFDEARAAECLPDARAEWVRWRSQSKELFARHEQEREALTQKRAPTF